MFALYCKLLNMAPPGLCINLALFHPLAAAGCQKRQNVYLTLHIRSPTGRAVLTLKIGPVGPTRSVPRTRPKYRPRQARFSIWNRTVLTVPSLGGSEPYRRVNGTVRTVLLRYGSDPLRTLFEMLDFEVKR
jgi:hypothetical protein